MDLITMRSNGCREFSQVTRWKAKRSACVVCDHACMTAIISGEPSENALPVLALMNTGRQPLQFSSKVSQLIGESVKPQCSGCQGPIEGPWEEEQEEE